MGINVLALQAGCTGDNHIAGLVENYGISNTFVLEIPQFTIKTVVCGCLQSKWGLFQN